MLSFSQPLNDDVYFYFRQGCGGGTTPGTASSFGSFGGNDADQEDNVDEEIDEKSPKLKGLDEADEYGKGRS